MSTFVPSYLEVVAPGATPRRVALVVHGIMGSASNWRGFFRKLVEREDAAREFRWLLVDVRHHGRNEGTPPPPDTLAGCARDLVALTAHLGVSADVTIGHSFGGKVVLSHAALLLGEGGPAPTRVMVLDSSLGVEPDDADASGEDVYRVIAALRALAMPLPSRDALVDALTARGLSLGLARWMTTNLEGGAAEGYRFRFDLDGIERLIGDYFRTSMWEVLAHLGGAGVARVVRGGRSERISDADVARLEALGVAVETLPEAGHWVHVDAPEALMRFIAEGLPGGR